MLGCMSCWNLDLWPFDPKSIHSSITWKPNYAGITNLMPAAPPHPQTKRRERKWYYYYFILFLYYQQVSKWIFIVHNVGQRPNLMHLGEPLRKLEVSFKKVYSVHRKRIVNARKEWVQDCRGCHAKTMGGKSCADTRNRQQTGIGRT